MRWSGQQGDGITASARVETLDISERSAAEPLAAFQRSTMPLSLTEELGCKQAVFSAQLPHKQR